MPNFSDSGRLPKYRKHKASGQAVVTINGRDFYLGPYGTKAAKQQYDRLMAEWLASNRVLVGSSDANDLTIVELLAAYLRFAKGYYGPKSSELDNVVLSIRPLKELYGRTRAAEFGPLALKAVRERMIANNLCRNEINKRTGRLKRIFAWAVENELVPPSIHHGLQAVKGLARGRSEARESKPVRPVPEAFVDALQTHVAPQVWAMIELQRLTGMRPGEVTIMRTCDIDTSGSVWVYKPSKHKTEYHGHQRQIYLGPRAQEILRPWLRTELEAFLFSPREAMEWRRAERHKLRKTPLSCGNLPGSNVQRKPKKTAGDVYDTRAYHQCVRAACIKADVPNWHPHQLRHNAATYLRKEFGLDTARAVLGHRSPAITEVYAELDAGKAAEVMGRVG